MSDMLKKSFWVSYPGSARILVGAAVLVAGCAKPQPGVEVNDPYEARNRGVHRFNLAVDSTLFGTPEKRGVLPKIPKPVAIGLHNVRANLGLPSAIINNLLQGKPVDAADNILRLAVNSTAGVGGIFDPASAMGLDERPGDFGQTLYVWGAREGAYLELPFIGPSTQRDFAGTFVDFMTDPVYFMVPGREYVYILGEDVLAAVGDRQRFATTIESILYESADSYAQSRLMYLQNRHYALGIEQEVFDPNEDPYAQ